MVEFPAHLERRCYDARQGNVDAQSKKKHMADVHGEVLYVVDTHVLYLFLYVKRDCICLIGGRG